MIKILVLLLAGLMLIPSYVLGGSLARAATRSVSRRVLRARILRQDALRHRVPVQRLTHPMTIQRYTTMTQAKKELLRGLAPGSHMTAVARVGRPMAGQTAKRYYGLLRKPSARETVSLKKGFPVRHSHATNAARGVRELTSPHLVPPTAIKKVVPLPK